jgi:predicted AAA+ superfamily ATPase
MDRLFYTLLEELQRKLVKPTVPRKARFSELQGKVDVAIGMRRTGKTYFLYQNIRGLLDDGVAASRILYLNFEDDRLLPADSKKLSTFVDFFYQEHPENHNELCYLFFDEIQNVEGWPRLVRRLLDTKEVRIYLTGSSAKLLSKEIATSLRGRSIATEIWPYSLSEYLAATGAEKAVVPKGGAALDRARRRLSDYIAFGGFPEVASMEHLSRLRVLQDYADVVLFRDVVERHHITNIPVAKYLLRTLLRNASKMLSVNKLFADLRSQGIKVSKNTLYEYIDHFQDAYLCFRVPMWSDSFRKSWTNPQKTYAIDTALAQAFNSDFSKNLGQMFENLVYLDLRRAGYEVYYYLTATRREVDFLAKDPLGNIHLFQVSALLQDESTKEREQRALTEAEQELGVSGRIVTMENYFELFG